MKIAVISRMSFLESTIASSLSRILSLIGQLGTSSHRLLWKWGPLFLAALLYTLSNLASRLLLNPQRRFHSKPLLRSLPRDDDDDDEDVSASDDEADDDDEEEDDDDDDDVCSSSCSFNEDQCFKQDYRVGAHSSGESRQRSQWGSSVGVGEGLSSLFCGNGIVKLWDEDTDSISIVDAGCDYSKDTEPPGLIVTGVSNGCGKVVEVGVWDTRVLRRRLAVVSGEWRTRRRRQGSVVIGVGIGRGVDKIYVSDEAAAGEMDVFVVGDLRKFNSPLMYCGLITPSLVGWYR